MSKAKETPTGSLAVRSLAMPADTNPNGDIFGGYLLSQMDIAGAIYSQEQAGGRTVTIAIDSMSFYKPLNVGDTLCCYCDTLKIGNTSIKVKVEAWAVRRFNTERVKITEGVFTYVAIDDDRKPRPIIMKK
jgi:acyl-CoA thioesterase YciA